MKSKKLISLILCLVFALPSFAFSVGAKEIEEEDVLREGDLSYIVLEEQAVLVGYCGEGGEVVLPETLGGYPLAAIRRNVFIENNDIISVHLPASLIDISDEQFCLCDNMEAVTVAEGNERYISIDGVLYQDGGKTLRYHPPAHSTEYDIPNTVTKIAPYAFFTNKLLAAITIPSSVTEIGDNAFYDCQILREVYLPDSVVKVGSSAFAWCINLKELRVPDELSDMGRNAFFPCYYVTHSEEEFVTLGDNVLVAYLGESRNIKIPEGVKKIGAVFFTDEELESVTIPASVEDISDYAFYGCKRLKAVKFPKNLKRVGEWAFFGCEKLKEVEVPSGAKVEEYAFAGCVKLESASVNTNTISAYAFARCDRLEKVTLGVKVKKIEDYAFYFCEKLTKLKLPSKLESIGAHALRRTGLEKLTLGATITKIGRSAFLENPDLVLTVVSGSFAHKYAKENGLKMTVKAASQKDKEIINQQSGVSPVMAFITENLVWIIVGGSVILIGGATLTTLLILRGKRRKRRALQTADGEEPTKE